MWLSKSSASSGVRPARLLLYCILGAERVDSGMTRVSEQSSGKHSLKTLRQLLNVVSHQS